MSCNPLLIHFHKCHPLKSVPVGRSSDGSDRMSGYPSTVLYVMLTQEKGAHRTCREQFLPQRLDEFYSPIINMTNPLENPTKPWPRRSHTAHCMRRSPQGLFVWRENLPAKYYLCTWNLPSHLHTHVNDNLRPCCLLGLVDGSCQVLRNIDTLWRLNHQR